MTREAGGIVALRDRGDLEDLIPILRQTLDEKDVEGIVLVVFHNVEDEDGQSYRHTMLRKFGRVMLDGLGFAGSLLTDWAIEQFRDHEE